MDNTTLTPKLSSPMKNRFGWRSNTMMARHLAALCAPTRSWVGSGGYTTGAEYVRDVVANVAIARYDLSDFQVVPISEAAGLVSYRARFVGTARGAALDVTIYVSTLWLWQGAEWVAIFSQDSTIPA